MKIRISKIIILYVLCVVLVNMISIPVSASSDVSINISCDNSISVSKTFTVKLSIMSNDSIGAAHIRVVYPERSLRFRNCEIEDKQNGEFIEENNMEGVLDFVYATDESGVNERVINMVFEPLTEDDKHPEIKAELIEYVSYSMIFSSPEAKQSLQLSFKEAPGTASSVSSALSKTGSSSSVSKSSTSNKKQSSSASKQNSKKESDKNNSASEVVSQQSSRVLKQFDKSKYKDDLSDYTSIYYLIGAVILLTIVILISLSIVRKLNSKYMQ